MRIKFFAEGMRQIDTLGQSVHCLVVLFEQKCDHNIVEAWIGDVWNIVGHFMCHILPDNRQLQ